MSLFAVGPIIGPTHHQAPISTRKTGNRVPHLRRGIIKPNYYKIFFQKGMAAMHRGTIVDFDVNQFNLLTPAPNQPSNLPRRSFIATNHPYQGPPPYPDFRVARLFYALIKIDLHSMYGGPNQQVTYYLNQSKTNIKNIAINNIPVVGDICYVDFMANNDIKIYVCLPSDLLILYARY